MKSNDFKKKNFIRGIGDVFSLFPEPVLSVRKLRNVSYPEIVQAKRLEKMASRSSAARVIHRALSQMPHVSVGLGENRVKGANAGSMRDSAKTMSTKLIIRGGGDECHVKPQYGVVAAERTYSDNVRGLTDMLALREDWKNVNMDMLSARERAVE